MALKTILQAAMGAGETELAFKPDEVNSQELDLSHLTGDAKNLWKG